MDATITIVGLFGTIALSINAFFLRGIFYDLNEVKVKLAHIMENSKAKELRIEKLEAKVELLDKEVGQARERIHTLDGSVETITKHLKSNDL